MPDSASPKTYRYLLLYSIVHCMCWWGPRIPLATDNTYYFYTCIMAAPDDDPLVFIGHLITSACKLRRKEDISNGLYISQWHVPPLPGTALRLRRGGKEVSKLHFFLPGGSYVGQLVYELWYMKSYLDGGTVGVDVVVSGSMFYVQTEKGPAPRLPLNIQVYASVGKAAEVSARLARVAAPYTAFVPAPWAVVLLDA